MFASWGNLLLINTDKHQTLRGEFGRKCRRRLPQLPNISTKSCYSYGKCPTMVAKLLSHGMLKYVSRSCSDRVNASTYYVNAYKFLGIYLSRRESPNVPKLYLKGTIMHNIFNYL